MPCSGSGVWVEVDTIGGISGEMYCATPEEWVSEIYIWLQGSVTNDPEAFGVVIADNGYSVGQENWTGFFEGDNFSGSLDFTLEEDLEEEEEDAQQLLYSLAFSVNR